MIILFGLWLFVMCPRVTSIQLLIATVLLASLANATENSVLLSSEASLSGLIAKWKLAGRWSTDCSPEATPGSVVEYEIDADGLASISNGQSVTEMRISSINADGDLTLKTMQVGHEQTRVLTLRRIDDTLRPNISRPERFDYTVRNGKFVASLKETAPLRHCKS
jgi:hypothetical protein